MSGFIKKARSAVEKLIAPRDRVLVAVSGGVDSLALLYLLHHFSKDIGFKLFVALMKTQGLLKVKPINFLSLVL